MKWQKVKFTVANQAALGIKPLEGSYVGSQGRKVAPICAVCPGVLGGWIAFAMEGAPVVFGTETVSHLSNYALKIIGSFPTVELAQETAEAVVLSRTARKMLGEEVEEVW